MIAGDALGDGGADNDYVIAFERGDARGGANDNVVLGWRGDTRRAGDLLDPSQPAPAPGQPDNRPRATKDTHMSLDGGEGNDWVLATGGTKVDTIGGLGRDVIYNSSKEGILWGDIANSIIEDGTDRRYVVETTIDSNGQPQKHEKIHRGR